MHTAMLKMFNSNTEYVLGKARQEAYREHKYFDVSFAKVFVMIVDYYQEHGSARTHYCLLRIISNAGDYTEDNIELHSYL